MNFLKKNQKNIIALLVILLASGGGYYYYQQSVNNTTPTYTTSQVNRGKVSTIISATGTINPINSVDVSTKVTGLLKEVRVKENETVKAGQVVAVIEDEALSIDVEQARQTMENAGIDSARTQHLHKIGATSDQDMEKAELTYSNATASYKKAQTQLNDTIILSPINGTIVGEPLKAGQTVSQGLSSQMIIVTVADLSKMQINVLVDETDIGKIALGQKADFTVDAYPGKKFTGTIANISKAANNSKGASSTATASTVVYYIVKVDIADALDLAPSMTARVSIFGKEANDVLVVPMTAIRSDTKGEYVYKINKATQALEQAYVKTGLTGDSLVEITQGLQAGDEIVVSGQVTQDKSATTPPAGNSNSMPRMPRGI
jgi:HlyD family secretion protein